MASHQRRLLKRVLAPIALLAIVACNGDDEDLNKSVPTDPAPHTGTDPVDGHGPMATGVFAPQGEPVPYATTTQVDTFYRGLEVGTHRFGLDEGLGPAFNLTFCLGCHEKPTMGGSAGLYRNFFLTEGRSSDGAPIATFNAGQPVGGVVRMYYYGDKYPARPQLDDKAVVVAKRNPIPIFGTGLIAGLDEEVILANEDPDDADGDGISGRANYREGFLGRFGVKAQTESIEGFIRGPLFNHLGVTTDPLTDAQRAELPIDSSSGEATAATETALMRLTRTLSPFAQATAPNGPLTDWCVDPEDPENVASGACDDVPDPEMPTADLFDLVSFSMLLAPPEPEAPTAMSMRGEARFDEAGCDGCHVPRLQHEKGPLPIYSDLLLHDMGPELYDGLGPGQSTGSEFRTQPLWGIASTGPYLHDGRASTIEEAILWHGGEGQAARDRFDGMSRSDRDDLIEFLASLGGRDRFTDGLVLPNTPIPPVGDWGGPRRELSADEMQMFEVGRDLFDFEFGEADGAGNPRLNGDSCRACHFEPVVGGAGPRGVNVTRHGILNDNDEFVTPAVGTILHRTTSLHGNPNSPQDAANIFEHRQTPHLFGLGDIQEIDEDTILSHADPGDADLDGISGRPSYVDGGKLGRFGLKGQVPTLEEFVRDAVTAELGMTLPFVEGLTYGRIYDNDDVPDPEFSLNQAAIMEFFLVELAPPPRTPAIDQGLADAGELVFDSVGCTSCHLPPEEMEGVPLYSDLLLHEILPPEKLGIEEFSANMWEFRTQPLWGLAQTAPYMHSGEADTLHQAIELHEGESVSVRQAYRDLSMSDRQALIAFLETL